MSPDSTTTGTNGQDTGTGTAPAAGTGTAQGPATGTAQGTPPNPDANQGQQAPDLATIQSELAQARATAEAVQRELSQVRTTDLAAAQRRIAELEGQQAAWEAERQSLILQQAVHAEATKGGAMYPDLVVSAMNPALVEWGKDGKPTNLAKVIEGMRASYPGMFRVTPGQGDGGAGTSGAPAGTSMNDLIRRGAGR